MILKRSQLTTLSYSLLLALLVPVTVVAVQATDLLHVLGVVAAIDAKHIEVKTARGPVVSVLLNQQVQFKNKNNPKSVTPPEVGDRVIIEATKDKQKVTAAIVHYSSMSKPSPPR
ncbi:MAG: hypothetical protein AB7P24_20760 [Nitrospira sp.]|nr:hypothetical protein [Nitrospira sp. WS238]